jgi:hypothetical protein
MEALPEHHGRAILSGMFFDPWGNTYGAHRLRHLVDDHRRDGQQSKVPPTPTADLETIAARLGKLSITEAAATLRALDPAEAEAVLALLDVHWASTIRRRM